jgi:Na+/proline symporter
VAYGLLYTVTNLVKWPVLGVMLGPILGENLMWRKDPARLKAYVTAGWLWVAMFTARLLVQYPLYKSGNVNALGTARLAMGYPLFILTAWGTWQILRKTPTTKID